MDAQEEVNKGIKARKKTLKAGSYVYKTDIKSAEQVWKVWWSSSLLSRTHHSLFSFFIISFSSSPSHNRRVIRHTLNLSWNAGSHQHGNASSISGKDEVRPLQLILRAHPSTWQRYITSLYILKNGHKWITLFHHHLSCAAAGWQARSSTWENVGSWCTSAPLQGKDSGSRGQSSAGGVWLLDCK